MSLKVFSWNLNGIRACAKSGFFEWLKNSDADIVLLQEVRAFPEQLLPEQLEPFGYKSFWHCAQKKGYSGVAIYTRLPVAAQDFLVGLGQDDFDAEGRFLGFFYDNVFYASAYFPNSQLDGKRLDYKLAFCQGVQQKLKNIRRENISVVLAGDFNIAHTEIDLAFPEKNLKSPGFLPGERRWFGEFLQEGYVDSFRVFEKGGGFYTWWSHRMGARRKNIGWRIDCHVVSENLQDKIVSAEIHGHVLGSDHCPVFVEFSK
jgi:exodeoxyribonuclease-3